MPAATPATTPIPGCSASAGSTSRSPASATRNRSSPPDSPLVKPRRSAPVRRPRSSPPAPVRSVSPLAALAEQGATGPVLAVEQATLALAELGGGTVAVTRDEPAARPRPAGTLAPGSSVSISLSAYERAFDAKLRLEAAQCTTCGTLSYPPRLPMHRVRVRGSRPTLVPLPRHGRDLHAWPRSACRCPG